MTRSTSWWWRRWSAYRVPTLKFRLRTVCVFVATPTHPKRSTRNRQCCCGMNTATPIEAQKKATTTKNLFMQTLAAKRNRVWVCKSARANTNAGRLLVFFVAMIEGWTRLLVELTEIATAERISLSEHDLCRNYGVKTYACPVTNIYTFFRSPIRDDRSFECRMENVMRQHRFHLSLFLFAFSSQCR